MQKQAQVEFPHLHSDNGVFTADNFCVDCSSKNQSQSFSGVGAQHAKVERAIQTIMYMVCNFLVHVSLQWFERGVDLALWSFAIKHAAWLHNQLPNCDSGLVSLELLTKTKRDHCDLLQGHVW